MKGSCDEETMRLQKEEQVFWERLEKNGVEVELKYARDLPDDTPKFILQMLAEFEGDVAEFCFSGAEGLVLDAGCGNGNLLMRALPSLEADYVGTDFSRNMLSRAATRAKDKDEKDALFLQSSVDRLPFKDQSFDRVICSGVLTCLPTVGDATAALMEFQRVLKPGGVLVVDFFNRMSHFTIIRRHLFREAINPPEYVSPLAFRAELERAGFEISTYRGFDFKLCQGYVFMSRLRPIIDPCFVQERFSRFMESRVVPRMPGLSLLGYRVYVKCRKRG
ncbi:MAG TPA: methyltransferase domain-containing protein [Methanotrichaceae archaeon]|nr:methyltransferase domain-containing protein [Methanotrichaceae archaeon]